MIYRDQSKYFLRRKLDFIASLWSDARYLESRQNPRKILSPGILDKRVIAVSDREDGDIVHIPVRSFA